MHTHVDVLVRAIEGVLTSKDYDLPSDPATAAKKAALQALSWCRANKQECSAFANDIFNPLGPIVHICLQ